MRQEQKSAEKLSEQSMQACLHLASSCPEDGGLLLTSRAETKYQDWQSTKLATAGGPNEVEPFAHLRIASTLLKSLRKISSFAIKLLRPKIAKYLSEIMFYCF